MKPALIIALCAAALISPATASAKKHKAASPAFNLGSMPFKKLPKEAQHALHDYRRMERTTAYRCYGLSEGKFEDAIGLLAPTDYNGDGALDYIFNSPCRPRTLDHAADILMSNPLGYEVARNFDAFVDVINGQPALIVEAACDEDSPEDIDGRNCYLARIFDRSNGHFKGAQRVSLAPDGSGFYVLPLERPKPPPPLPPPPPPPPVVVIAPLPAAPEAALPPAAAPASSPAVAPAHVSPPDAAGKMAPIPNPPEAKPPPPKPRPKPRPARPAPKADAPDEPIEGS